MGLILNYSHVMPFFFFLTYAYKLTYSLDCETANRHCIMDKIVLCH